MLIGLTYDLKESYLDLGLVEEELAEFDSEITISAIAEQLVSMGYSVERIGGVKDLVKKLSANRRWDLVFNIAEGYFSSVREAEVPALLEVYGIPFTFSSAFTLALCLDKAACQAYLRAHEIAVPDFHHITHLDMLSSVPLTYPLFVKPNREGSSKGIGPECIVRSPPELAEKSKKLLAAYPQGILLESYLPGREFTAGVLGTGKSARVLGVMEIIPNGSAETGAYTLANKKNYRSVVEYQLADPAASSACAELAQKTFRTLQCRDAARIDMRMDTDQKPHVIDVNPLAGLHPKDSDLVILLKLQHKTYGELVGRIVESALERARTDHV